jgi:NitT/TauT family transport system substrate-binding protein
MKIATVTPNGADTSPLIIGKEKGIFDQCGIDLEFASFNTNPDVIRSSTSGATNLSGAGPAGAITAMIAGQDLSIVSGAYQTSSHTTWVVSPDSPIKTVKDLAGKKIGVASPGGPTEAEIRYVLEKEGIDPNSAQYVVVGAIQAGIAAMAAGQVDSTYTGDPTLPTLLAQNPPIVRPLVSVDDYVRTQSTVYVGTTDWVTSHKAEIDRFLACVAKAQDYVKKNVEEAAQIYAKVGNIDPTVALAVLKYAVSKDAFSLAISDEGIDFTINQLKLAKAIPQDFTKAQLAPLLTNLRPA